MTDCLFGFILSILDVRKVTIVADQSRPDFRQRLAPLVGKHGEPVAEIRKMDAQHLFEPLGGKLAVQHIGTVQHRQQTVARPNGLRAL